MSTGEGVFVDEILDSPEFSQRDEIYGAFVFNESVKEAYREIRFKDVPAMRFAIAEGKTESIAEHMWATQLLWRNIQGACPALAASIDSEHVAEMLGMHDVGEIKAGDIGRHITVNGGSVDKHLVERIGLENQVSHLPAATADRYLSLFDEFENKDPDTQTTESVVANLIDSIHGDMHFFDLADEITDNDLEITRNIVLKYTRPHFVKLLATFESEGNQPAFEDVMCIVETYGDYVANHRNSLIRSLYQDFTPQKLTSE